MANQEHLDLLKQGAGVWNKWRKRHPEVHVDCSRENLSGLDLRKADLSNVDLFWAGLRSANLRQANLSGADLTGTDLTSAKLNKANLEGANLSETNLAYTDLTEANLSRANLILAHLVRANLTRANLNAADLSGANLSEANLRGALLTGCRVYAISAWDVQLEEANQLNLVITRSVDEPTITVDDLEVAQFVYLLLNHKKLRSVINSVAQRGVLILGRFGGGGLEVLQAIAEELRRHGYVPMLFDFERPQDRDYTETVKTLAGLARFIVVDLSGPSVPQELSHTVPFFDIPFVPILEKGRNTYAMFVDLLKYPWVLRPLVEFTDIPDLLARVPSEIIAPAEERHQARQQLLDELFRPKS
jgi:uncharacterized protein YjbI with pentapeptide repeats